MMRVAFIMPCRNKAAQVRANGPAFLAQECEKIDVFFSDHCSRDDTVSAIKDVMGVYTGPHNVRMLHAPKTEWRGMMGYNAHISWLHETLPHDVFIILSADDVPHPKMVAKCIQALTETEAEYVATRVRWRDPDGSNTVESGTIGKTRMVTFEENIDLQIGLQSNPCWTRSLWDRCAPIRGVEQPELILSSMAALRGKLFFINEILHDAVNYPDPFGVSTERAIQATDDEKEKLRLHEANMFHYFSSHASLSRRIQESGVQLSTSCAVTLVNKLIGISQAWQQTRERMTLEGVEPMNMRVK
jgi:hypothetical protein